MARDGALAHTLVDFCFIILKAKKGFGYGMFVPPPASAGATARRAIAKRRRVLKASRSTRAMH
jgi:hypothetical protein